MSRITLLFHEIKKHTTYPKYVKNSFQPSESQLDETLTREFAYKFKYIYNTRKGKEGNQSNFQESPGLDLNWSGLNLTKCKAVIDVIKEHHHFCISKKKYIQTVDITEDIMVHKPGAILYLIRYLIKEDFIAVECT